MISSGAIFNKQRMDQYTFTPSEEYGFNFSIPEGGNTDQVSGVSFVTDCFHCHGFGSMQMSDYLFYNNGLDATFAANPERAVVSVNPLDSGCFKGPSLRNVELSGPFTHDGRFASLKQVIEHYIGGAKLSTSIDIFMKFISSGLQWSDQSKVDLIAFLKCLTDTSFVNNDSFCDPHE